MPGNAKMRQGFVCASACIYVDGLVCFSEDSSNLGLVVLLVRPQCGNDVANLKPKNVGSNDSRDKLAENVKTKQDLPCVLE